MANEAVAEAAAAKERLKEAEKRAQETLEQEPTAQKEPVSPKP